MSAYTTGELAKRAGVSVRTVQYYDTRGLLSPSAFSEGGRRLYSAEDLKRFQIILFLRDMGLSLNAIQEFLQEESSLQTLTLLLQQQETELLEEQAALERKLSLLQGFRRELKEGNTPFTVETIGDIAHQMKQKNIRKKVLTTIIIPGIPIAILEWTGIVLWITKGYWWLFLIYLAVGIPYAIWATRYMYKHAVYRCPECHDLFKPSLKEVVFAAHTPTLRKLTCTHCGFRGYCVEIFTEPNESKNQ